jgi:Autophagy-related protein 13
MDQRARVEIFVRRCFFKLTQLIVQSRRVELQSSSVSDTTFNLRSTEILAINKQVELALGALDLSRSHKLSIKVYFDEGEEVEEKERRGGVLLEHWQVSWLASNRKAKKLIDVASVHKNIVIMCRSLYTYLRVLPAHQLYRKHKTLRGALQRDLRCSIESDFHSLAASNRSASSSSSAGSLRFHGGDADLASQFGGETPGEFAFGSVTTHSGKLQLAVHYRLDCESIARRASQGGSLLRSTLFHDDHARPRSPTLPVDIDARRDVSSNAAAGHHHAHSHSRSGLVTSAERRMRARSVSDVTTKVIASRPMPIRRNSPPPSPSSLPRSDAISMAAAAMSPQTIDDIEFVSPPNYRGHGGGVGGGIGESPPFSSPGQLTPSASFEQPFANLGTSPSASPSSSSSASFGFPPRHFSSSGSATSALLSSGSLSSEPKLNIVTPFKASTTPISDVPSALLYGSSSASASSSSPLPPPSSSSSSPLGPSSTSAASTGASTRQASLPPFAADTSGATRPSEKQGVGADDDNDLATFIRLCQEAPALHTWVEPLPHQPPLKTPSLEYLAEQLERHRGAAFM